MKLSILRLKNIILFIFLFTTLWQLKAQSKQILFTNTHKFIEINKNSPAKFEEIEINSSLTNYLLTSKPDTLTLMIPIYDEKIAITVKRLEVKTSDFFVHEIKKGIKTPVSYSDPHVYYAGEVFSHAVGQLRISFSLSSTDMQAIISGRDGNHEIIPIKKKRGTVKHVISQGGYFKPTNSELCAGVLTPDSTEQHREPNHIQIHNDNQNNMRFENLPDGYYYGDPMPIYFECDYQLYNSLGSNPTSLINFVVRTFANVQAIYHFERLQLKLKGVGFWSSSDPESAMGPNMTSILSSFRSRMQTQGFHNASLTHYLLYRNAGGGLAYRLDWFCGSDYRAGASSGITTNYEDYPNYSWNAMEISHEIGHNFGCHHTQSCSWPGGAIDDCYTTEWGCERGSPNNRSTIMSYCHLTPYGINLSRGFGFYPGNRLRDIAAASSGCTPNCVLQAEVTFGFQDDCIQNSNIVQVRAFNGVPPYTYLWDNGDTDTQSSYSQNGYRSVRVTDANGCSLVVGKEVIMNPEIPSTGITGKIIINDRCSNYALLGFDGTSWVQLDTAIDGNPPSQTSPGSLTKPIVLINDNAFYWNGSNWRKLGIGIASLVSIPQENTLGTIIFHENKFILYTGSVWLLLHEAPILFVPNSPNNISATASDQSATISFDLVSNATTYTVTSSPGGFTATGATSPITITGLTNGTSYTFTVVATNNVGSSDSSSVSNMVIPTTTNTVLPPALTSSNINASAAYSLRKINTTYNGFAVRVRRSSDNAEQNIGFTTNGDLDETALTTFVGAGNNGFVSTWYDQSGNNRDLIQNNINQQPFIVISGIVAKQGNRAAVRFNGASPQFLASSLIPFSNSAEITVNIVHTELARNPNIGFSFSNAGVGDLNTRLMTHFPWTDGNMYFDFGGRLTFPRIVDIGTPLLVTYTNSVQNNLQTIRYNGGGRISANAGITLTPNQILIGSEGAMGLGSPNSHYSEFIVVASVPEVSVLAALEANQMAYYSISNLDGGIANTSTPTNVIATAGNTNASVTFDIVSGATSYIIISQPGNNVTTAITSPVQVSGLTNGTTYTFTVKAVSAGGVSAASAPSNSVIPTNNPSNQTVPSAPLNVVATPGGNSAIVSFNAPHNFGNSPILSYTVTSFPGGFSAIGTSSPITVEGLNAGINYSFSVVATNAIGSSTPSWTSNYIIPYTVPNSPTNVVADAGNASATISFDAPSYNGGQPITNYTITSVPDNLSVSGTSSPLTITGLTNGTPYYFKVVATNIAGNSLHSNSNLIIPLEDGTVIEPALNYSNINASAAYSLRKINSAYTGFAVKVRRSSDNAQQNIGFTTSGDLDETALTTFVGAGNNGFVSTWYDQSGNNRDLTQNNTNQQPYIVISGNVVRQGNRASVRYNGIASQFLASSSLPFSNSSEITLNIVHTELARNNNAGFSFSSAGLGNVNSRLMSHFPFSDGTMYFDFGGRLTFPRTVSIGTPLLVTYTNSVQSNLQTIRYNGAGRTSGNAGITLTPNHFVLGSYGVFGEAPNAHYSEFIVVASVPEVSALAALESNQMVYYGISNLDGGIANTATPTNVVATAGNTTASVSFDTVAGATSYIVSSQPGNIVATATASPIQVTGLTNGTLYTFTVKAVSTGGVSAASEPSNSIIPTE